MNRWGLASAIALLYVLPVAGLPTDDTIAFSSQEAAVRLVDGRWLLMAGKKKIKDLGTSESTAYEVLRIIRDLKLNEYGAIGAPRPVIEYWLSDGKVPQGVANALRVMPFDDQSIHVAQAQDQWCLRDARRVLFAFGPRREDAERALAVLKSHGFNRVGYVGFPAPAMMYFLRSDDGLPQENAGGGTVKPLQASRTLAGDMLQAYQLRAPMTFLSDPSQPGERTPIDWRLLQVRRDGADWKLLSGDYCMANFGGSERDAREGLRVMQSYRFTEEYRLSAAGGLSLLLANGQPPRGVPFGLRRITFRPQDLGVKQEGERWVVCESGRPLPIWATSSDEAHRIVQTIQRHKLDNLCQLGSSHPAPLTFLVKDR